MSHTFSKPPEPLELTNKIKRGANWKKFIRQWNIYEVASGIDTRSALIQAAAFKNVIGKEALDKYETLEWDADGDKNDFKKIIENLLIVVCLK